MDNMREVILSQYKQITHSLEVNKDVKVSTSLPAEQDFDSIILCGMGGSGHPGDLLNALSLHTVPLYVHRNYNLPADYLAGMNLNHPLVIASSYSGNTEETLTAYQAAQKKGFPLLGSAAGGTLKEWAKRDGVPFSSIDYPNMQPRHTLFAAFTGIYRALKNSGLAPDITSDLKHTAYVLAKITPDLESPAKKLAHAIKGKVPVYNSSDSLGFAAKNFKIQTNENAKYPGFWNTFPELNHNELIGFSKLKESENPNRFIVIMLHNDNDHPRIKARMKVTAELYRDWGVEVVNFTAQGETLLEKIFYAVTFGLWTTMFQAESYGIDPIPVEGLDSFKAKLKDVTG